MDNQQEVVFACSADETVRKRTRSYWILASVCATILLSIIPWLPSPTTKVITVALAALIFVNNYLWSLWFRPLRYVLSPSALSIVTPLRKVAVPFSDVKEVQAYGFDYVFADAKGGGGGHGFYGYLGRWRSKHIRDFHAFVVHLDHVVVITRAGSAPSIVLSPDDIDGFISAISARLSTAV